MYIINLYMIYIYIVNILTRIFKECSMLKSKAYIKALYIYIYIYIHIYIYIYIYIN